MELLRLGIWVSLWGFATVIVGGSFKITKPVGLLLCFLALMGLQVLIAVNNHLAYNAFYSFVILILCSVVPLIVLPRTVAEVRILIVAYFALHLPTVVHGILHNGTGLGGWLEDENDLAFALLAALGVGAYVLLASTRTRDKLLAGIVVTLTLLCIVRTNSRGGFLGLVAEIAYIIAMGPQRKRIVAILIIAGALTLPFVPASYWTDMQSIETATNHDDTGYQRLVSWVIAWEIFKDHPVLGVGSMNYLIYGETYADRLRARMYVPRHFWGRAAHSLYLTLLSEQGIVGTAIFIGLMIWYFRAARRIRRRARTLASEDDARWVAGLARGLDAGMIGALSSGAFLTVVYYPVIWVLVGLMASLDRVVPESAGKPLSIPATNPIPGRRRVGAVAAAQS